MAELGVPCGEDNIVITCGSQQALEFLGRLLLSPGDTALVTAPTYLGALQAFSAYEPRYDELRPEQGNRTPASYADAARDAGGEVKFAYVVPSFANPTGETLSRSARERLLDLARLEFDLEESAYAHGSRVRPYRDQTGWADVAASTGADNTAVRSPKSVTGLGRLDRAPRRSPPAGPDQAGIRSQ